MNYKRENRIPWLFTDSDNIKDFLSLFRKFSKNFPWPWKPWCSSQTQAEKNAPEQYFERKETHNNKTLRLTNASKIFRVASKFSETKNFLSSIHQRLLAFPCTSITILNICVFSTCRVARVLGRLFSFRNCWISRITLKENKTRVNKAEIHAHNQSINQWLYFTSIKHANITECESYI